MDADINEVARTLYDALDGARIPTAIGGAIAYGFWGAARATKDVDLNVFLRASAVEPALDVLARAGLTLDRPKAVAAAAERGDAVGWFGKVRVDLFFDSIPLHESASRRAVTVSFLGKPARILSAEDLTVFKALFNRPKDWLDIERLVALQGPALDRAYIRQWLVDCVGEGDSRVEKWDGVCRLLPPMQGP